MKKIRFRKFGLLYITIAALIILGATFAYGKSRISAPKSNEEVVETSIIPTATADEAPQETFKPQTVPDMPILMYHHIRDYTDQNDKIGYNLSVSPEVFSKQLDLITSKGYTAMNFKDIGNGNIPEKPIILTFDDGYDNFYLSAYPALKKRKMKAVVYIIHNNIGRDGYLSEIQIKELLANDIEIGSHTLSHPDLTQITSDRAIDEISQSKNNLESKFDIKILSLCYPSGKVNQSIENIAETIGYQFAVTTKSGLTTFSNPFRLNRYRINHDTSISPYLK